MFIGGFSRKFSYKCSAPVITFLNLKHILTNDTFFSLESNSESVLGVHDGGQGSGVGAGVELVDLLSRNQDGVIRTQVVDLAPDVDLGMAFDHPEERLTAFRVDRSWARAEAEDNDVGLVGLAEQPLGSGGHDL